MENQIRRGADLFDGLSMRVVDPAHAPRERVCCLDLVCVFIPAHCFQARKAALVSVFRKS
jgi:hypothetical protein